MPYLQYNNIFKYILMTFILFAVLFFLPPMPLGMETIIKMVLLILIILCVFEHFIFTGFNKEGMENSYNESLNNNMYNTTEEYLKKVQYNDKFPGYYMLNNGNFSENGIDYDKAQKLINDSKYNDLYNQHNFIIKWSPHTHIGKDRVYVNIDKVHANIDH